MKKMMNLLLIALAVTTLSCKDNKTQKEPSKETHVCAQTQETKSIKVDALMKNPAQYYGKEIRVEGIAKHVCEHTHRKLFLEGVSGESIIRCIPTDNAPYSNDLLSKIVEVKGHLVEDRIDEAYLQNWEAQLAKKEYEHHGKEGEGGCSTEKKARGEKGNTPQKRIADFRQRIKERQAKENKDYLSFYHFETVAVAVK